jgi:hypothetical protein
MSEEIQTERSFKIEGNCVFLPNDMIEKLKKAAKNDIKAQEFLDLLEKCEVKQ